MHIKGFSLLNVHVVLHVRCNVQHGVGTNCTKYSSFLPTSSASVSADCSPTFKKKISTRVAASCPSWMCPRWPTLTTIGGRSSAKSTFCYLAFLRRTVETCKVLAYSPIEFIRLVQSAAGPSLNSKLLLPWLLGSAAPAWMHPLTIVSHGNGFGRCLSLTRAEYPHRRNRVFILEGSF